MDMPRPPRIFVPELPAHVWHRGNNGEPTFSCENDFLAFRACLAEACRRFGVAVHAYVLMTNHVHLVLSSAFPKAISMAMQSLDVRYARYQRAVHERTGTVWGGRFRAAVINNYIRDGFGVPRY